METEFHTMNNLFLQLGLPDNDEAIEAFINQHKPLPANVALNKADCWNNSQRAFLTEAIAADSDWAEVVDHLDAQLR
ncbi:DUF2789 domain-containing protein [Catenovulum sp. 2E275]|uniref:DUF2789 domain-containing protein n=1 Tax=Catenovulum sp. 2E275 TaxID=2980497 RepID=UPI0021D1B1BA|nr:DUF2789 domain-containing protein [Catenovulum sp. 2E275]MCU4674399.1 DUF2789 domain-containing protein [Catenovulum sp. 2E275]